MTKLLALFDLGASYTIISKKGLEQLRKNGNTFKVRPRCSTGPTFVLANGDICRPEGSIPLPLRFGEETVIQNAWVMDGGDFDVILGIDFMRRSRALLRFSQESNYIQLEGISGTPTIRFDIRQQETLRGGVSPLVTGGAMLLKPRTRTRTLLSVTDGSPLRRLPGDIVGLIDRNEFGKDARHCLAHSISSLKGGKVVCEISNFTGRPAYIPAGTIIGSFAIGVRESELIPFKKTVLEAHQEQQNGNERHRDDMSQTHCFDGRQPGAQMPKEQKETKRDEDWKSLASTALNDYIAEEQEDCPLLEDGLPSHLLPKLEKAKEMLTKAQYDRLYKLLIEFAPVFSRKYEDIPNANMEVMRVGMPAELYICI